MQTGSKYYTSKEEAEKLLEQTLGNTESKQDDSDGKKPVKKRRRVISRTIYIVLILAMLTMLGKVWYQKLNNEQPSLFGYEIYVVETGSMIPTLPIGSNILVRQLRDDDLPQVGDIITYNHSESKVTHRIVDVVVGDDGVIRYQTQGDNPENSLDPWLVEREDIQGIVIWHFSLSSLLGR